MKIHLIKMLESLTYYKNSKQWQKDNRGIYTICSNLVKSRKMERRNRNENRKQLCHMLIKKERKKTNE